MTFLTLLLLIDRTTRLVQLDICPVGDTGHIGHKTLQRHASFWYLSVMFECFKKKSSSANGRKNGHEATTVDQSTETSVRHTHTHTHGALGGCCYNGKETRQQKDFSDYVNDLQSIATIRK